jgi:cell division protein ZipA
VDIKDLILLVGGVFFAVVVGHGLWVAWKAKQNDISMDIAPSSITDREPVANSLSKSEFPHGGARIAKSAADIDPVMDDNSQPAQGSLPLDDFAQAPSDQTSENLSDKTQARQNVDATQVSLRTERRAETKTETKTEKKTESNAVQKSLSDDADKRSAPNSPDELIILGVLAKAGSVFNGPELVDALRGQGLKFGNMSIFHRIDSVTNEHLFSVANAVEPGTFDLADMEALKTPGITFFLQLPVPGDAFETLEDMLLSARTVAAALGGDVKDDQMNMLTGQTVEHMRQRLADYARRRLTQRPEQ